VPEEESEHYEVKLLPASSAPTGTKACEAANPFTSMIESKGTLANTFRVISTGCAGKVAMTTCEKQPPSTVRTRSIVATFQVSGFLDFVYFTNFETEDPGLYNAETGCAEAYYSSWNAKKLKCGVIEFVTGDEVEGPFHTNDAAKVSGEPTFGREGHNDKVEIFGGTYPSASCPSSGGPTYNTATKCYVKGTQLLPPPSDESLEAYVESAYKFEGSTHLTLNGSANTILVSTYEGTTKVEKTLAWPKNGLIYVKADSSLSCSYSYETENSDESEEVAKEKGCGTVYAKGSYSSSLTIGAQKDLIVNGNLYPKSIEASLGSEPKGTAVLGLIATEYVRVYHACESNKNGESFENLYVYAAILSTGHSWVVDNSGCGNQLGYLHVYGAIAQNYRGIVRQTNGSGTHGYLKDYKYDERLATDEPPYFLAPLKAGWKVIRETAPKEG
jgi:hypothetical protein